MEILQALGEAGEALSFSALRERVGLGDSGQFNYHLDRLEGPFVERVDDGYRIKQAGRRVVEAVFSGVMTEEPAVETVDIDRPCSLCDSHSVDGDELCDSCGNRYATMVDIECGHCIFEGRGTMGILLFGSPAVQAFKVGHGENLVAPSAAANPLSDLSEDIRAVNPFEARYTFTYEGDSLTVAVDEELRIVEVDDDREASD